MVGDHRDLTDPSARGRRRIVPTVPHSEEESAFRAAAWLVVLVVVATALLALAGRNTFSPPVPPAATVVAAKPETTSPPKKKKKPEEQVATASKPKPEATEPKTSEDDVAPRALPVEPAVVNQATPAVPLVPGTDTNLAAVPVAPPMTVADLTNQTTLGIAPFPTAPVAAPAPQTAFEARAVAESSLTPSLILPSGAANLLKVIGRRTENSPAPQSWTYYFYDTSAIGNATHVTVRNNRVINDGEALTAAVIPWHQSDVVDESKLKVDSNQALAIAQALIPNTPISSSQFELRYPKDSTAPIWFLTLWAKDHEGQEVEIGTVQVLADTGYVLRKSLKSPDS
jgi:hypothetical protein